MLTRFRQSMSGKLIFWVCAVTVAVLVGAFALVHLFTNSLSIQKEQQAMHAYLVNTLASVDDRIKDLGRASVIAVADARTQQILTDYRDYDYREQLDAGSYIQGLFLSMITSRSDVSGLFLFDNQSLVSKYMLYTMSIRGTFRLDTNEWFQTNLKNSPLLPNGARIMVGGLDSFLVTPRLRDPFDNQYFSVLREINSFRPYRRVGYMIVTTRMSALDQILTKSIGEGASYVLTDRDGVVLLESTGRHFYRALGEVRPELAGVAHGQLETVAIGGERFVVLSQTSSFSALTLYVIEREDAIYRDARRTQMFVLWIFLAAAVLILAITSIMIRRTVKPITNLATQMESFSRTNTRLCADPRAKDEAKRLGDAFNNMMDTINELIFLEYERTIQLQDTKLRQQQMQLKYLQSQINPHFLYNTLDTIRIKASINGDTEVAALIMKLVAFFRFGMGNTQSQVPIRHEVKLMQVYLQLMQCRYPTLEDEYQLDESLMGVMVPSFILQPLVENSLTHGLKAISYQGKLTLTLRRDADVPGDVLLELSDNGIGMSDSLMRQLNDYDPSVPPEEGDQDQKSVGVRNVQERLHITFGEGYGLHFRRNGQSGVTVAIRVAREPDQG